jgi:hypothetical protein
MAALSLPIPTRTLDESLEEEGGSLPGKELGWKLDGRL